MLRFLHKYRKHIMWGVVILIVPTFIAWGGYRRSNRRMAEQQNAGLTVATVGKTPVTAERLQYALSEEADRRGQYGQQRPTFQEMAQDGTANRVLDNLVLGAVLDEMEAKRQFKCGRELLIQRFKESPRFLTEDGRFDAVAYNTFIDTAKERQMSWNDIYDSVNAQVGRDVLFDTIRGGGRVLDADMNGLFDEKYSTLKVKYVKIMPPVVPTQEQIQATYDADPAKYQIPEQRTAQVVAVSLRPPAPPLVAELVERARAGEDFAELAKKYSEWNNAETGGDLTWVLERDDMPDLFKRVFEVPVGQVSDPIWQMGAWFIYKVEEERKNEDGVRERKARNIAIKAQLTEAERADLQAKASDLLAKAKETGDLAAAAAAAGLSVATVGPFSVESNEIAGIGPGDVWAFRGAFNDVAKDAFANVIEARENLYVAKVTDVVPAVPQPLDAVRDRVEKDTIRQIEDSEEYANEILTLAQKIAKEAKSLDEILTLHPELNATIEETEEFSVEKRSVLPGILVPSKDIYALFKGKEPGAFAGPLKGYRPPQFFFELVSLAPPSQEEWPADKRAEEEKKLRDEAVKSAQNRRFADYLKYLKEHALVDYDNAAFARVIGVDKSGEGKDESEGKSGVPTGPAIPANPSNNVLLEE